MGKGPRRDRHSGRHHSSSGPHRPSAYLFNFNPGIGDKMDHLMPPADETQNPARQRLAAERRALENNQTPEKGGSSWN